jgi:hypothetical protein
MPSKARKLIFMLYQLFTAVETNSVLLSMLEIATSPARRLIFTDTLLKEFPACATLLHLANQTSDS